MSDLPPLRVLPPPSDDVSSPRKQIVVDASFTPLAKSEPAHEPAEGNQDSSFKERWGTFLNIEPDKLNIGTKFENSRGEVIYASFSATERPNEEFIYFMGPSSVKRGRSGAATTFGPIEEVVYFLSNDPRSGEVVDGGEAYYKEISAAQEPELYERLKAEDAFAKKISRRTPRQHADILGIELRELFPRGADVLVVGDPAATLGRYDLGCRMVIQDYEFIPEICPPLVEITTGLSDAALTPREIMNSWLDSIFNYDLRSMMQEGYDAEHPEETSTTWYHHSINRAWNAIIDLVGEMAEKGSEERKDILERNRTLSRQLEEGYKADFRYGDLFYYPNRIEKWKSALGEIGTVSEVLPENQDEMASKIATGLTGHQALEEDGTVHSLSNEECAELGKEVGKELLFIRDQISEIGQLRPLSGGAKLDSLRAARGRIMATLRHIDPKVVYWDESFLETSPELRVLDYISLLDEAVQPQYGEVVAKDLIEMHGRVLAYYERMYPSLERDLKKAKGVLSNEKALYAVSELERSWWRSEFALAKTDFAQLAHSYFPDPRMAPEQFDRIVGVYSVSTHAWDTVRDEEEFKRSLGDSIRLLKPGGRMYVGPLNYQKERIMRNADEAYRGKTRSKLGYPLLAKGLDRLHEAGVVDFEYGVLSAETGYWQYRQPVNSGDLLREVGFASYLMVEKKPAG